ncbi:MAG: type I-D CRISPR-associated protein Cas10d/Csc3 [Anaerolineae bacterium]|nr:type I-D CRISPR-associated protein Cas10d/Csc3 [Anaerolineae bacterium]
MVLDHDEEDFESTEMEDTSEEALVEMEKSADGKRVAPAEEPLLKTLFKEAVDPDDSVLRDFAEHVIGPLSYQFATVSAKGGAFFREREARGESTRAKYDQNMRAHLLNGMLPALRIARLLKAWGSRTLRTWDETAERLFVAGYMLHDFTKIPAVKATLVEAGFEEMEAPSPRMIPTLEAIFIDWGGKLGLDAFLQPLGGMEAVVHEVMYIACNTQVLWGTARAPALFPKIQLPVHTYLTATEVSRLADLVAYAARTPRQMVSHETINRKVLGELSVALDAKVGRVAKLVYHHVAENRGLLLNFIHDGALQVLTIPDQRVPLLYAPSGVVYLERHNAPPMPTPETLMSQIVLDIRSKAGEELISKGKGARRDKFILLDENYNDLLTLSDVVKQSSRLVAKLVSNSKAVQRIEPIRDWLKNEQLPSVPTDAKDSRLDRIAEWLGLMENQLQARLHDFNFTNWVLHNLELDDLRIPFTMLLNHPVARKGGVKYWWFWLAAHYLMRHLGITPDQVVDRLEMWSVKLVESFPKELPETALANEVTWDELGRYIGRVLTVAGGRAGDAALRAETARYQNAKGKRGGAICTICGSEYTTRKVAETAVAFQPGVYTARIRIGSSDNKRSVCTICALEQLLRQLFVENLDSGSKVEGQRVRYLSLYPTYFFTPETLKVVRRAYNNLKDIRLSDKSLRAAITQAIDNPQLWQRLTPFLLRAQDGLPSKRLVRYGESASATFLMLGWRGFNDPSDTESWILPAFLSLLLPICLDVKVIASESAAPLMTEADEVQETIWFEGAHASTRALTTYRWTDSEGQKRDDASGRIMVDAVLPILRRYCAATLIHLDSEYAPPDEHWNRFAPIAQALMESPLYVFHYLAKQMREDKHASADQINRYVRYAQSIFNDQEDQRMSYAKQLVEAYRGFYRAKSVKNANSILRPLSVVADALLVADMRLFSDTQSLVELSYGELYRFMDRVEKGSADGRFPKGVSIPEREAAMRTFCTLFVKEVFVGIFNRDVSSLRGRQLNLLKSACEALYRDAQNQEWAERGGEPDAEDDSSEETTDSAE